MAVLSDHELWSLLRSERLKIQPLPEADAVKTSSVDLTLANKFTRFRPASGATRVAIDTRSSSDMMLSVEELGTEEILPDGQPFRLEKDEFALAWTREKISLPNFLCARVEGRSTLARFGLSVHQTAPTVHATFTNELQLELKNSGPYPLLLYPGSAICQLIIETMSSPSVSTLKSVHQGT